MEATPAMSEETQEKYSQYIDEAMQELLAILKNPSLDLHGRLAAAHEMHQISDNAKLKDLMGRTIDQHGEQHRDVLGEVKRLKKREPWQDDEQ
jgi:hypothetical protein